MFFFYTSDVADPSMRFSQLKERLLYISTMQSDLKRLQNQSGNHNSVFMLTKKIVANFFPSRRVQLMKLIACISSRSTSSYISRNLKQQPFMK